MSEIYPNYYKKFKCIADKCLHNCCIGWEIDIDEETAEKYKNCKGAIGAKMASCISFEDTPHFILSKDERCPFLNQDNLCEIITALGEEALCSVCDLHPRFKNELPDRIEVGLGMACEEAARLILSEKTPFALDFSAECDDEIIILRDKVISILQNREKSILSRIDDMLCFLEAKMPTVQISKWAEVLLSLERLDSKWTTLLQELKEFNCDTDIPPFDNHMKNRQTEYEQLIIYFIYRHFANAFDIEEAKTRACFAILGYKIIFSLGAMEFKREGKFDLKSQVELCRLFSSEIEYSDENVYILLDEISNR